jgi:hypothetical protein
MPQTVLILSLGSSYAREREREHGINEIDTYRGSNFYTIT